MLLRVGHQFCEDNGPQPCGASGTLKEDSQIFRQRSLDGPVLAKTLLSLGIGMPGRLVHLRRRRQAGQSELEIIDETSWGKEG